MSNTFYKQIIPATDWYFRHENVSGVVGKSTVYQLAAWALKENGEIVGLVTVRDLITWHCFITVSIGI
ncbi:TPA: hypothetical protein U0V61_004674 [Escherichia coli]|nr:hypothetical protein [Escherichia marmotae]MEC9657585.1 hypothetical protein [Escherichia coli]MED8847827.1 hypothetical protein [Escherichia coli]MED9369017.1 hypothetical protein [Escherichia coli]MED9634532.1 hypothetical protein [Escherichia marmotae]